MASKSGPDIIEDGLVLCLDAASKRSYLGTGTVWTDLKGANNGTLTNGPTFDADNGGSIVFDGANDRVDVSNLNSSLFTTGATIFAFLKLANSTPSGGGQTGIWGFGSGQRSHYPWTDGYAHMNTFRTSRVGPITLSSSIDIAKPHSLCITSKNSDRWKMYQNTELVSNQAADSSINLPCNVFGQSCGDARYLEGAFYSFLMYNRALTADEIRRNYLSTKERFA